jgi:3-oxoadipate CoA-transferase beta subunit
MMDLLTKKGESKIVRECTYPLTGIACVKLVYTDLATFECTPGGLRLVDAVEGIARPELEKLLGLPLVAD